MSKIDAGERLIQAAQKLYELYPLSSVGVEAILAEAAAAKATLYKIYGAKEGLTAAVLARASARMLSEFFRALELAPPDSEMLDGQSRARSSLCEKTRGGDHWLNVGATGASGTPPQARFARIGLLLAQWRGAGDFSGCLYLRLAAQIDPRDHVAGAIILENARVMRMGLERLAMAAGVADPVALAAETQIAIDGALRGLHSGDDLIAYAQKMITRAYSHYAGSPNFDP